MNIRAFLGPALGALVVGSLVAGCGESQPAAGGQRLQTVGGAYTLGGAWMAPAARSQNLLYISDNTSNDVLVYTYPKGDLVGTLTGFGGPLGECVDSVGDVWIVNSTPPEVIEYAHGGTAPIATLSNTGQAPFGCSVDGNSGNLAVATESGSVAIYAGARGNPTFYSNPAVSSLYYCSYDDDGNLFVDGDVGDLLAELRKGSGELQTITLDKTIDQGSMQWTGAELAIVGLAGKRGPTPVYHVQVYGSTGSVVGSTLLQTAHNRRLSFAVQYWLEPRTIVGPVNTAHDYARAYALWKYPAGGRSTKTVHASNATLLWGTTISKAKH